MASRQFDDAFKSGPSRFVPQRPRFISNGGYNNYQENFIISNNESDERYYGRASPFNDSHINQVYTTQQPRSSSQQQQQQQQQFRRVVISSNSQQNFTEINDRKRPRMEYYYKSNEYQPPSPIQRKCIDGRINVPTTSLNQNTKPPVVLRPITRISKPQYPPHKVIQRYVDRHPNTIIIRGPNVPSTGGTNLQQSVIRPRNLKEEGYVNKLKLIKKNCRNMIFTNAAMVDEISRVNFTIQTITEEVQMLAKKVQHLERNKLRRYQQLLKREALSCCKDKFDNDNLIPNQAIDIYYDTKVNESNNDKEQISEVMTINRSYLIDPPPDIGEHFENHEDKSNEPFFSYDIDHDIILSNDQLTVGNEYYQNPNPFDQYNNEHSIIL